MVEDVHYLTPEGLKEYEERLNYLRNFRRQEVAERLRLALEEGGELVENAEYEDAKNEQAFIEGVHRDVRVREGQVDPFGVFIGGGTGEVFRGQRAYDGHLGGERPVGIVGDILGAGDAARLTDAPPATVTAVEASELLFWEMHARPTPA